MIIKIFALIGISFSALFLAIICTYLQEMIISTIKKVKWKYKYKHRFDKTPTAKCYCKDCENRGKNIEDRNMCRYIGWIVDEDWFCYRANPREKDPENK